MNCCVLSCNLSDFL